MRVFVNKTRTESLSPFDMKSYFLTAFLGAIHDFTYLKQEFEQIRIFNINKYIFKIRKFKLNKVEIAK